MGRANIWVGTEAKLEAERKQHFSTGAFREGSLGEISLGLLAPGGTPNGMASHKLALRWREPGHRAIHSQTLLEPSGKKLRQKTVEKDLN